MPAFIVHSVARSRGEPLARSIERALGDGQLRYRTPILADSLPDAALAFVQAHGERAHPIGILTDTSIDSILAQAASLAAGSALKGYSVVMSLDAALAHAPAEVVLGAVEAGAVSYELVASGDAAGAARLYRGAHPQRLLAGVMVLADLMDDLASIERLSEVYLDEPLADGEDDASANSNPQGGSDATH